MSAYGPGEGSGGGGGGGINAAAARNIAQAAVQAALSAVKVGRFTLASTRAGWGGLSTGSNAAGRVVAAPTPQTIALTADGALSSGITLDTDTNVVTVRDAGRVKLQVMMKVEAWNTDGNAQTGGNNSRSDIDCFIEKAASGSSTFTDIEESHSSTSYGRVAKPYWNHGPGEMRLRTEAELVAEAGDQFRVRAEAEYNQASTVQHAVLSGVFIVMQ